MSLSSESVDENIKIKNILVGSIHDMTIKITYIILVTVLVVVHISVSVSVSVIISSGTLYSLAMNDVKLSIVPKTDVLEYNLSAIHNDNANYYNL